ncbi:hypothetical protein [Runella slithyformis]|uniref:Uncharacterized protein n=1 Tax=Runella slithyformis (strain ATCC 29530 / DSM 19594 / LMG 11500 / NCIMB 11436 / LSU 4) TaxID=761193 RepID=A0A7U3ZK51_RUNSL|nr:hypothetical protein [Runella slithyformis]AEI48722.1 hypothetical protein Runsl_2311 [Runella slithyformis DSM 19594]
MKQFNSPTEKESYYAKRRQRGLIVGAIGGAVLGLGFLIQYILYMQGTSFNGVMYAFTGVGILMVLYAGVEIFGW